MRRIEGWPPWLISNHVALVDAMQPLADCLKNSQVDIFEDDGAVYITGRFEGSSREVCQKAADITLAEISKGHAVAIRVIPESNSHMDFLTNAMRHTGYVRFAVAKPL